LTGRSCDARGEIHGKLYMVPEPNLILYAADYIADL